MQIELKLLQVEVGITFVFVTHDQEEALSMSDRIAVMLDGHVEQLADPDTVYDQPTSAFVAGFIGQNNFFPGAVANHAARPPERRLRHHRRPLGAGAWSADQRRHGRRAPGGDRAASPTTSARA